jgi:hypothetical protein
VARERSPVTARQQAEAVIEHSDDLRQPQRRGAGSGELYRQRNAIEVSADLGYRG